MLISRVPEGLPAEGGTAERPYARFIPSLRSQRLCKRKLE